MSEYLKISVDKFTFHVDPSCDYTSVGVWIRIDNNCARLGLSDYLQQRSGDIAFVEVKPIGTILKFGDEFSSIETIKVNIGLSSPVSGKVVLINPAMIATPEIINQDPFGEGWICEVEMSNWVSDKAHLLDASIYLEKMRHEAEEESKR
jgi:glycine cleavage system H protein